MSLDFDNLGNDAFWDLLRTKPELLARKICEIDITDVEECLRDQPSLRAWINAAHETAKVLEERAKWELKKTEARVLLRAKAENDPNTNRAKTVQVLDAEVESDPEVESAMEEYFDAQQVRGGLRAIAEALGDRRDMLIQIAAKQRDEQKEYR